MIFETRAKAVRLGQDWQGEVEPGISAIVIALNMCGYRTTASCEGHAIESSRPYPWVRIVPATAQPMPSSPELTAA